MAATELIRGLAILIEPPGPESRRVAALLELPSAPEDWQYTELLVEQLYPYASVYLGAEGKLGGDARDRVAGFWRALGEDPPREPDHLALLLGLYAHLGQLEAEASTAARRAAWHRARGALLWEHLDSWVPLWLGALARIADTPYREWGALLTEALAAEREVLTLPDELPLHLREAPPLPEPAAGSADEFLEHLLAPVRTGFILTRSDLARCADDLGLGMRAGERRYVLRALLGQSAAPVLGWLAGLAETTLDDLDGDGPVAAFWADRARRSAALLRRAAVDAG